MLFLGVDVGTTGVKAAVFDALGAMRGYAFEEYSIRHPAPGRAEQDAEQVFAILCAVIERAVQGLGSEIAALSLSVQGDAVVAVDKACKPLLPVHLGMDYRCARQAEAFARAFSEKALFEKTGMRPHPMNSLCKIRWIMENRPDIVKKVHQFMTYADFLLARLGSDEPVIDYTMAGRTMGFRLRERTWDEALLRAAGITKQHLSKPVPSGTRVGTLHKALAARWGLSPQVTLVAGGHDQCCAALGAGLTVPDLALDSHGTAEVISSAFSAPRIDEGMFQGFFPCYAHAVPGMFFTFSLNHAAGVLLKWFVEGFCREDAAPAKSQGERIYEYVLKSAGNDPSPLLVLPYWNGSGTPTCDLTAKGMIVGLTLSTTRYDIARAIVEALCFDMRENLEALNRAGMAVRELRCVGGGARSPIGLQLKADITGLPVHTLRIRESACLGAAMLAAVAAGAFPSLAEAAGIVRLDKTYTPEPLSAARYRERYALYRELYPSNKALLSRL